MASNVVRMSPMAAPPQPSQQDWVWDGANWCWGGCPPAPCPPFPTPPPCPPAGFPTPCPPWFPPPAGQAPWYPGANGGVSFSAAPPVNPIRGNFWWDGTTLHLFDGAAWVNIGPAVGGSSGTGGGAAFVGTSPPSSPAIGTLWWNGTTLAVWDGSAWKSSTSAAAIVFAVSQATNIGLGSSTWAPLIFTGSPAIDTMSGWNPANGRYTPTQPGLYAFRLFGIVLASQTGGVAVLKDDPGVFANAPTDQIVAVNDITAGPANWVSCFGMAQMNGTTDYVRCWGYNSSSTFNGTGPTPVFSVARVG